MFTDDNKVTVTYAPGHGGGAAAGPGEERPLGEDDYQTWFENFLLGYRNEQDQFQYRDTLRNNVHSGNYSIQVDLAHVAAFHEEAYSAITASPGRLMPTFESAARAAAQKLSAYGKDEQAQGIQVQLYWSENVTPIRELLSDRISQLVAIPGIVINVSRTRCQTTTAVVQCRTCKSTKTIQVPANQHFKLPTTCEEGKRTGGKCQNNPFQLIPNQCSFRDSQIIKLQEMPEEVPTGELPRNISISVDRNLCDVVSPGSRVYVVGIQVLSETKVTSEGRKATGVRRQFIKGVGVWPMTGLKPGITRRVVRANQWLPEDEAIFLRLSQRPNIYETIAKSIDPAVFGLEDVKKAIACQLFAGTRKVLPDETKLRGDINILLIGDPSTAKSQLLKYTHKISPIAVYTSGKGSSAAGLTASVVREKQGDFFLEGGALVLADGGVVCIDEFDKMGTNDQVAIHEAMEQQTISIAKAGITTVINSRAAVLAAANPRYGAYDPLKSNEDQMDFHSTILTRFDLIFRVLDPRDPSRDRILAKHVIDLHKRGAAQAEPTAEEARAQGCLTPDVLKGYIAYCRDNCYPQLDEGAKQRLLDFYVQAKRTAHNEAEKAGGASAHGHISITTRQLEAVVRISEAIAKMHLRNLATLDDVEEAIRLFNVATMDALTCGVQELQLDPDGAVAGEIRKVEQDIRKRLPVGTSTPCGRLSQDFVRQGYPPWVIERAILVMVKRDELEFKQQRKVIVRKR